MPKNIITCGLSALVGIVTGCEDKPLAFNYCSTPVEGWEPGDTLKFHVDTVKTAGAHTASTSGCARRRQRPTPFSPRATIPFNRELCDTVMFKLTNQRGDLTGTA